MYQVYYSEKSLKQLKKMDKQIAKLIVAYIRKNLADCENPRIIGKALQGNLSDKWRYRVGDYRILAKIEDDKILISIIEVAHRKEIYK